MNSRAKGKAGELELAVTLRSYGYEEARRGQQYQGGTESPDVIGVPGVHLECKRVEAGNLYDWYDQAVHDAGSRMVPVVAHRRNGKPHKPRPWVVILSLHDFLLMRRELEIHRARQGAPWPPQPAENPF